MMKKEDVNILREVQKNAGMGIKAIDTVSSSVDEDSLALMLARFSMEYSRLYNRASDSLIAGRTAGYRESAIEDLMLKGGIKSNTILNTSPGHIAELMIQGSNRGILDMQKTLNHNEQSSYMSVEIAKELWILRKNVLSSLKSIFK